MRESILVIFIFFVLFSASGCGEDKNVAVADNGKAHSVMSVAADKSSSNSVDFAESEEESEPAPKDINEKTNFSEESRDWYFLPKQNQEIPGVNDEIKTILEQTEAFYVLPNEQKQIYLTFDEGYELGYTSEILDTLQANNIKVAFFITGHYIESQPELVKRMQSEGHLVCNHTWNHPDLSQSSPEDLKEEILSLEREYEKLTGTKMASYLRPPMGKYSEKSLYLSSQMGYSTVFWSMAFEDWDPKNQPGADYSYHHVIDNIHPGAVILLHAVSQSNSEALDRIIKTLKENGYVFSTFSLTGLN